MKEIVFAVTFISVPIAAFWLVAISTDSGLFGAASMGAAFIAELLFLEFLEQNNKIG
jgi:hypothetical protein